MKHWHILILIVLAIIASALLWWLTPYGVAMYHDSLFYILTAENVANGEGVYWTGSGGELKPLVHFPPLYPVVLALPMLLSIDPISSARMIAAILFGCNAFLVGFLLYRYPQNIYLSLLGILWISVSPVFINIHLMAMSEPLFFCLTLVSILFVGEYLNKQKRSFLVVGAFVAAFAALTRYSGIAVIAVCSLGVLFLRRGSIKEKLIDTGIFAAIGGVPLGLWMLRNYLLSGSTTNRTFQMHLIDADTIRQLLDVIIDWITSIYLSHWVEGYILIFFFVSVILYLIWRIWIKKEHSRGELILALLLTVFPIIYLSQIVLSLSFFDASTRIDDRILSPVFLSIVLTCVLLTTSSKSQKVNTLLMIGLFAMSILVAIPRMWKSTQEISMRIREGGTGFASRGWQESNLIQWIRSKEDDATIITNQAMAVRFLTNDKTVQVPERWDPVKDQERAEYEAEMNVILEMLEEPNTYLVLFRPSDISNQQDLSWLEGLALVYQNDEGKIYSGPSDD